MMGALAGWALVLAVAWLLRRRRRARAGVARTPRVRRRLSLGLVVGIVAGTVLLPVALSTPAYADGYSCKEAPSPQTPGGSGLADFVDSDAASARGDGSDYGKYGWAGLSWSTYDLGCGPDLTRAPGAVFDTSLGNAGLNVAKTLAATGIWLDRQSHTTTEKQNSGGGNSILDKIDVLVDRGSHALRDAFFTSWVPVALLVLALLVLFAALRGRASNVVRLAAVGLAGLWLAGLFIGAPLGTVHAIDSQFTGVIGDVQGSAMHHLGVDPNTGPRSVVYDDIIEREWKAGWFGDPDSPIAKANANRLRSSLALSYADQQKLTRLRAQHCKPPQYGRALLLCQAQLSEAVYSPKHKDFEQIASQMKQAGDDDYAQFTGKSSNRTTTGLTAAIETFTATIFWIFASLLKFVGLMVIRLAALFAPVWLPAALISESVLMKIVRFIGAALFWAVAASGVVAMHLVVMTQLFDNSLGFGNGWRVFLLALVTAVLWMILRPFKRLTQFAGMNINATAGGALRKARSGGAAVAGLVGGGAGYLAGKVGASKQKRSDGDDQDEPIRVIAQEGTYRHAYVGRRRAESSPAAIEPVPVSVQRVDASPSGSSPAAVRMDGPVPVELTGRRAALALAPAPVSDASDEPSPARTPRPQNPTVVEASDGGGAPRMEYSPQVRQPDGELVYQVYSPDTGGLVTVQRGDDGVWH